MMMTWTTRRLAVALAVLHACGMALFWSGFMLTKIEVTDQNPCEWSDLSRASGGVQTCRGQPGAVHKIVLVVIDALRHDFVVADPGPGTNRSWVARSSPEGNQRERRAREHRLALGMVFFLVLVRNKLPRFHSCIHLVSLFISILILRGRRHVRIRLL